MKKPIIVALDFDTEAKALALADALDPTECRVKVGKELFTRCGPGLVSALVQREFDVFLDLKFHDIPNTVAKAVRSAAELGVWMVNVHASGGSRMMIAAREAIADLPNPPLLIAVTVLTSMSADDLQELGVSIPLTDQVLHLASLAAQSGLDGVVCSAQEAALLKARLGTNFVLVTPGIRPLGSALGDQRRVMTPEQAAALGIEVLVIGRPITEAADPANVLRAINRSLTA